jgi:hypothetical protein
VQSDGRVSQKASGQSVTKQGKKKTGPKTLQKQRKRQARKRYVFKAKTLNRSPEREKKIKEEKSASPGENVATRSSSSSCCLTCENTVSKTHFVRLF